MFFWLWSFFGFSLLQIFVGFVGFGLIVLIRKKKGNLLAEFGSLFFLNYSNLVRKDF
jgi:hypothetical protein